MDWQDGTRGMVREPDHHTSEAAAEFVTRNKGTIRQRVLAFAERTERGFIDHDLLVLDTTAAESSFRKRRTELTEEGVIVATSSTRLNRNGRAAIVYVHRKFHPNPPPEQPKLKGKAADAVRRGKRERQMHNALVRCASYHAGIPGKTGEAIAAALGIPYPIQYTTIPALLPE